MKKPYSSMSMNTTLYLLYTWWNHNPTTFECYFINFQLLFNVDVVDPILYIQ